MAADKSIETDGKEILMTVLPVIPNINTNNSSNANTTTTTTVQNKAIGNQDTALSPTAINQQIVWIPKIPPQQDGLPGATISLPTQQQPQQQQPPPLFSIKQLNYSQVIF